MESNQRFRGGKKREIFLFMFVFVFGAVLINILLIFCYAKTIIISIYIASKCIIIKVRFSFFYFFYLVSRRTFTLVAISKPKSKSLDVFFFNNFNQQTMPFLCCGYIYMRIFNKKNRLFVEILFKFFLFKLENQKKNMRT